MCADRILIYDTTLRDGAQTPGVDFSLADKHTVARMLDELGVGVVEGGWPGANPTDSAFFAEPPVLKRAAFAAFGMTRRPGRSADNDPGLNALAESAAPIVCMVGKAWDFHVDAVLGIERAENVLMIAESVRRVRAAGKEVHFDAEHFFDGYKANPEYTMDCVKAAHGEGARWIVLCDTNGGTLPHEISEICAAVAKVVPGDHLGIHCHNDTGNAAANTLAAVRAGVRQVQGTLNGLGERCGNADLITLIPSLALKMGYDVGMSAADIARLTSVSRAFDELLNRPQDRGAPYVGERAFSHKGGLHAAAVAKDPRTYEHIEPGLVGNARRIVVSDQAGRAAILARFREAGIDLGAGDAKLDKLVETVKAREFDGYAFDGAEASFELLARRELGQVPDYFRCTSFRVLDERRWNDHSEIETLSEATVKIDVAGRQDMAVAEGNGPVNALDAAMRKVLTPIYPELEDMTLVDYKVRILNSHDGTRAVTRVMIESADKNGGRWTTVGVSPNIIDASYGALRDGIFYKLHRDGARVVGA
ncbi:MAG: citramalate synthase [Rhodospirillales bacterium]